MKILTSLAKAYIVGAIVTVMFFNAVIGPGDAAFNIGLALTWPMFWAMGLIFILAAMAA